MTKQIPIPKSQILGYWDLGLDWSLVIGNWSFSIMEYPCSKFNRGVRLLVLAIFLGAFFFLAPTVVLYSAGYRYDIKNGLLRETGSLNIDVMPKNATAYLEGVKIDSSMPIRLNSITPHKYALRISAPGYYDWSREIEINKNQTTYIKEISLLQKGEAELISKIKGKQLKLSGTSKYLAAVTDAVQKTTLMIIDLENQNTVIGMTFNSSRELVLTPAPRSDYFAVSSGENNGLLFIIDAASLKLSDMSKIAGGTIDKFTWNGNSAQPEIYFSTGSRIVSYSPLTGQTRAVATTSFLDWSLNKGELWVLTVNTSTKLLNVTEDILGFKAVRATLAPRNNETMAYLANSKIDSTDSGTIVIHSGETYRIIRSDKTYLLDAKHFYISKYNNWYLFWSPSEVWTYSVGEEPFLLSRPGSEILDVQPLDQYNTLAFRWNNKITALYPYYYIERTLVDGKTSAMAADSSAKILYYSDQYGVWRLDY